MHIRVYRTTVATEGILDDLRRWTRNRKLKKITGGRERIGEIAARDMVIRDPDKVQAYISARSLEATLRIHAQFSEKMKRVPLLSGLTENDIDKVENDYRRFILSLPYIEEHRRNGTLLTTKPLPKIKGVAKRAGWDDPTLKAIADKTARAIDAYDRDAHAVFVKMATAYEESDADYKASYVAGGPDSATTIRLRAERLSLAIACRLMQAYNDQYVGIVSAIALDIQTAARYYRDA
jgi:hypothetical protein